LTNEADMRKDIQSNFESFARWLSKPTQLPAYLLHVPPFHSYWLAKQSRPK
jgi:hypothetical protein